MMESDFFSRYQTYGRRLISQVRMVLLVSSPMVNNYDMNSYQEVKRSTVFLKVKILINNRFLLIQNIPCIQNLLRIPYLSLLPQRQFLADEVIRIVSEAMQEVMFVSIEGEANGVRVFLPSLRPLYSISQVALYNANTNPISFLESAVRFCLGYVPKPLEDLTWAFYTFVPQSLGQIGDLVAPYSRVAMIVEGTELLTFDGKVQRIERATCPLVLMAHPEFVLTIDNGDSRQNPQLVLKTLNETITIDPYMSVTVNDRVISSPERISNGQYLIRLSETQDLLVLKTRWLRIVIHRPSGAIAVEASGWTFGASAGLLGAYDGEISTDFIDLSGERMTSPKRLTDAWAEQDACTAMPSRARPGASLQRALECELLLRQRSRCQAVVRPDAFVEICRRAECPTDAFHAYNTMCWVKGVVTRYEHSLHHCEKQDY